MFHHPVADSQSSENRQFVEDGIAILSHCDSDIIARRGVSLLKTMLNVEDKRSQLPSSYEAQVVPGGGMGLDIAAIIQTFYKQDRDSLSGQPRYFLQTPPTTRISGDDHWPNIISPESSAVPSSELLVPFGVDYAEGLDDILSLATNYLS